jgi:large subunit ribosomal protein L25
VLNIVSHSVSLYCPADFIPEDIVVDLTGMQVNQSVHLSQIKLPDRVTSASREDVTLCAVTAQAKEEEVATDAPAAAEVPASAQKAPAAAAAAPAAGAKGAAAAPAKGAAPAAAAAAPKKK